MTESVAHEEPARRGAQTPEELAVFYVEMLQHMGQPEQANAWLDKIAGAQHPGVLFSVGRVCLKAGRLEEAEKAFRAAADAGHDLAATNVGAVLMQKGDLPGAEEWFRRGAELGDEVAVMNLGSVLIQRGDYPGAERCYRSAIERGWPFAISLGTLLLRQGRLEEAKEWFTQAAEEGMTEAAVLLGWIADSDGDMAQAQRWYTMAARAGLTDGEWRLGQLFYRRGETGKARAWWTRAADKVGRSTSQPLKEKDGNIFLVIGDRDPSEPPAEVQAAASLGWLLLDEGERPEGLRQLQAAAEAGHSDAAVLLGRHHVRQDQDFDGALRWFGQAHDLGHPMAAFYAGALCELTGREPEDWWVKSAEAGNGLAAANLAAMYRTRGDISRAIQWYRHAAETSGYPDLERLVGQFSQGPDLSVLVEWLHWCADRGHGWAAEIVRLINNVEERISSLPATSTVVFGVDTR